MKKLLTICLMLLGAVAQAQNFAITATTEAAIRKNIVKGNAANYGFGMINDTLKLVGLTTRNVIFTGSTSKNDIGLSNVDNTSDLNKPVSTATQTALNLKQNQLNGTGFVKTSGTTISYDNSTYLSTSTAASTYLPISNPTATGTLTAPTIANSLGANFATTSGNVGIGTTTPSQKLEVASAGETSIRLYNTLANTWDIKNTATAGAFQLVRGGSNIHLHIDNTGNVGIGTTAPNAKLELSGTGTVSSRITSTNSTAQLITSGTVGQIYNTTGDLYLTNASTTNSTLFVNNGAERMRIFANGRVGINTTTDAGYLLDVNGTLRITNDAYFATTNGKVGVGTVAPQNLLHIKGTATVGVGVRNSHLVIESTESAGVDVGAVLKFGGQSGNAVNPYSFGTIEAKKESAVANNYSSYLAFFTIDNTGGATERMRIGGNGSISVGTTTADASAKLDITSTTQGVLFPRMTTTQINAISSPANGLTVYNTTLSVLCFYDGTGWRKVSHSSM